MPRFLGAIGLAILVAATVLLIAGEAGAVPARHVDAWFLPAAQAGVITLAAALALLLLAPFGRMVRQGRCARCGVSIEKNQTYCHDHLKNAVQEFRDHNRTR